MCALHILADAAKVKVVALRVLQNLAKGTPAPPDSPRNKQSGRYIIDNLYLPHALKCVFGMSSCKIVSVILIQ